MILRFDNMVEAKHKPYHHNLSLLLVVFSLLQVFTTAQGMGITISRFESMKTVELKPNEILKGVDIRFSTPELPTIHAYYGVRYAALGGGSSSPSGSKGYGRSQYGSKTRQTASERRFETGVASFIHDDSQGTLIKSQSLPVCPQNLPNMDHVSRTRPEVYVEHMKKILPHLKNQAEDCLSMNLFVPNITDAKSGGLSVLVFVHGESYEIGSGNAYDPSVLASYGRIIVITLNYRLGILGFLITENSGEKAIGNMALYDLFNAIQWIHDNIGKFGGDNTRVTLMGHSYGAALVNLYAISILKARDYGVRRLVLLSGSALSPLLTSSYPQLYMEQLVLALNTTKEALYSRLKHMPVDQLLALQNSTPSFRYASRLGPIVTKYTFPDDVLEKCMQGRKAKLFHSMDLLMGFTTNGGAPFISRNQLRNKVSREEFEKTIRTFVRQNYVFQQQKIFDVLSHYYTDWRKEGLASETESEQSRLEGLIQMFSDAFETAPGMRVAQLHAQGSKPVLTKHRKPGESEGRTWAYLFEHKLHTRRSRSDFEDAIPGDDLPFLFGAPIVDPGLVSPFPTQYSQVEKRMSENMMRYLSNFVKSGDPNHPMNKTTFPSAYLGERYQSIKMPRFKARAEEYLVIGKQWAIGSHLRSKETALWFHLIPSLHKPDGQPPQWHKLQGFENTSLFEENSPYFNYQAKFTTPFFYSWIPTTTTPQAVIRYDTEGSTNNSPTQRDPSSPQIRLNSEYGHSLGSSTNMNQQEASDGRAALIWTVAAGCALLVLNVLVFAGIYYQAGRLRQNRCPQDLASVGLVPSTKSTLPSHTNPKKSLPGSPGGFTPMVGVNCGSPGCPSAGKGESKMLHGHGNNYTSLSQVDYPPPVSSFPQPHSLLPSAQHTWTLPRGGTTFLHHDRFSGQLQDDNQPVTMV